MSDEIDYTTEVWKTIADFPNYAVSNIGRVRKILPQIRTPGGFIKRFVLNGYAQVTLSYGNLRKRLKVHRLVAVAFLEPDTNRPEINHKNGAKADNRVENLEWVTHGENQKHAYEVLGREPMIGVDHPMAKLTEKEVLAIRIMPGKQRDIAAIYGISQNNVWRIKHGKIWKHI